MKKYKNIILILAAVAVTLAAFIFAPKGVEYSGTDDAAEKTISSIKRTMSLGFHQFLSQQVRK